ncbi:MAG: hypothetical protein M0Z52_10930 [Actinomycetota bacterium]|nr:hypothetical protein [Actinomycetota bacterium]
MKEDIALKEHIKLVEKEVATLTGKLAGVDCLSEDLEDIKAELKALKLFLGRQFPDFKKEFPELIGKVQA